MATETAATPVRILIINPNTSTHMTEALKPVVEGLGFPSVEYSYFTCPPAEGGIASINSTAQARESAEVCLPALKALLAHHDAFLVACYSEHPLVGRLKRECAALTAAATKGGQGRGARKYVTGIFEASVTASLTLLVDGEARGGFGIVSTGKIWEEELKTAVEHLLGYDDGASASASAASRFVGCETTGLNASELHDLPAAEVRTKMMDATKRLLRRGRQTASGAGASATCRVQAICLGCAGMVGLDDAVRTACVEELGLEAGKEVYIVDGVKAGVGMLYGLARAGF